MRRHKLIPLLTLVPTLLFARGPLPPAPDAVTSEGIRYSVAVVRTETEFGVDVLAERLEDAALLSRTPGYRIRYKANGPKGDQEIYPVSLEIRGDRVFVTREDDQRFSVSLSRP